MYFVSPAVAVAGCDGVVVYSIGVFRAVDWSIGCVCSHDVGVLHITRFFYPSTSSTPNILADSPS